jgi:hypothetical protein
VSAAGDEVIIRSAASRLINTMLMNPRFDIRAPGMHWRAKEMYNPTPNKTAGQ